MFFLEILSRTPNRVSASHFVCICMLSLFILYVCGMLRHGGRGGKIVSLQLRNGKIGWGTMYLHLLYPKIG